MTDAPKPAAKIVSKVFIGGTITAVTGLHIGGNSVGMAIGGADNVVVRNPINNEPYIPGSSLRGKIRSMLERVRGHEDSQATSSDRSEGGFSRKKVSGKPAFLAGDNPHTMLGRLFGVAAERKDKGPTRLIVRDAGLTDEGRDLLASAPNTDMPMTEIKTEVWIDRITSAANPRQMERVPAGARFDFALILTVLDEDNRDAYLKLIFEGLELVEADALGGSGSRGYGQVKFTVTRLEERTAGDYKERRPGKPIDDYAIPQSLSASTVEEAFESDTAPDPEAEEEAP